MATATRVKSTALPLLQPVNRVWNSAEAMTRFRFTTAQYFKMLDLGWFQDRRVEMIAGEMFDVERLTPPAWFSIQATHDALRAVFKSGFILSTRAPLHLSDDSHPEPDVAVIRGNLRDFQELPHTAELAVEVAETTLAFDRNVKASLYAAALIPEYWIVNPAQRQLETYRKPIEQGDQPFGFGYAEKHILKETESVTPLAAPKAKIKVADLLP